MRVVGFKRSMIALVLLVGCGQVKPSDNRRASGDAEEAAGGGEDVSLEFTAEYKQKPVDVVIIRENSSSLSGTLFRDKFRGSAEKASAYRALAVRLFNSELDMRVGVLDAYHSDAAGTNAGMLRGDVDDANHVMTPDSFEFVQDATDRMDTTNTQSDYLRYHPLLTLQELLKRSQVKGNEKGMIRNDAMLSVLFIGFMDERGESVDTSALISQLNEVKGPGNWQASVIGVPATSCKYKDAQGTEFDANQHSSAANSTDPAVYGAYTRRAKLVKLQEESGGLFISFCEESFIDFMADFVDKGTKLAFFTVKLDKKPDPSTISVTIGGVPVEGWQYDTVSQLLSVPTSVKNGTKFSVTYKTPVIRSGETINGGSGADGESVNDLGEAGNSPAQLAFLNDGVRDALAANCNSCHNNRYNSFDTSYQLRAISSVRVRAGEMPPADPTWGSSPEGQLFLEWADTY